MAIKISNTTVINDSRGLENITNLKTVGGQTILGSGNVTISSLTASNNTLALNTVGITSAVNQVSITNAATGNSVTVSATGTDTNISLTLTPKGTGNVITSGILRASNVAYFQTATLTDGATINWNTQTQQVATVTLAGNRTMAAPTNLLNGAFYAIEVVQDATGNRTLAWNSVFKWVGGTVPTLSTAANSRDYFIFRTNGTNLYEQGRTLGVA